ncbi:hypothetical protein M446_3196 [Methylobacterium sp. 4-46]|uniref:hypothetical protein n=1 Tax=unclassified Methylobacterium TaxID=2615210 RepID=UPI000152C146|nr:MULTISPECIES: hypothetical protein [Methylobacterium]ACA17602.1 hypothetical protein M446_3196 [Methylobacterium sp. 4-46]WFT83277.1 hypothetical protein QA634_16205 [Methylobacterium nodulans]
MTTGIRGLSNRSDTGVSFVNTENSRDDRYIHPNTKDYSVYAWISQHRERPLVVQTKKGTLKIWDSDWKIYGNWNGQSDFTLIPDAKNTQDYFINVDESGDIYLSIGEGTKNRYLQVTAIKCIKPSEPVASGPPAFFLAVLGGAAALAVTVGTAGTGAIVLSVAGGAIGGLAGAASIYPELNKIFDGLPDDVFLSVNGNKVWPQNQNCVSMKSQERKEVNMMFQMTDEMKLEIYDWDVIRNDVLGSRTFHKSRPEDIGGFIMFGNNEGALYEVECAIVYA